MAAGVGWVHSEGLPSGGGEPEESIREPKEPLGPLDWNVKNRSGCIWPGVGRCELSWTPDWWLCVCRGRMMSLSLPCTDLGQTSAGHLCLLRATSCLSAPL